MHVYRVKKSTVSLLLSLTLGLASLGIGAPSAQARENCGPSLWKEVKMLARTCIYLEKSGRRCEAIRVFSGRSASFYLGDALYRVRMEESAYSDGGDLDDLYIERDDGCQLERKNVLAFGDILAALAR
jgi:hypothetical protein